MLSVQHVDNGSAAPTASQMRPYISFTVPAPTSADTDLFNVQLDDGRVFTVSAPECCQVGDTVHAIIIDSEETGESSLLLIPRDASVSKDAPMGAEDIRQDDTHALNRGGKTLGLKTISAMAAGGIIGTLVAGPIAGAVVVGVVLTSATVRDTQTYKKFAETNLGVKTIAAADAASAKMKAFDDKLGVSVAVKNTKESIVTKAIAVDQEYEISERTISIKTSVENSVNAATDSMTQRLHEVDEMYKVSENSAEIIRSIEDKANKIGDDFKSAGAAFTLHASQLLSRVSEKINTSSAAPAP